MGSEFSHEDIVKAYSVLDSQKRVAEFYGIHDDTVRNILRRVRRNLGMDCEQFNEWVKSHDVSEDFKAKLLSYRKLKPELGAIIECNGVKCVCVEILDEDSIVVAPIVNNRPAWRSRRFTQSFDVLQPASYKVPDVVNPMTLIVD